MASVINRLRFHLFPVSSGLRSVILHECWSPIFLSGTLGMLAREYRRSNLRAVHTECGAYPRVSAKLRTTLSVMLWTAL